MGDTAPAALDSLLEIAEAARRSGRLSEGRQAFLDAAAAADRADDRRALVTAALGAGGIWVHERRDVVERAAVQALWERAAAVVPACSLEESRLAVRRAAEAVYEGEPAECVLGAVERVRVFGDAAATAEALSLLHHVHLGPCHATERLRLAEEIITLAARGKDDLLTLTGLCWRTVDLFLLGDPRAGRSLTELRERSATAGCEALSFIAEVLDAMLLARAGRLTEAEAAAEGALSRGTAAGDLDAPAYYGGMIAALRWWQGRADEILDLVRMTCTSPRLGPYDHVYVAADALLSATVGDRDAAEESLARLMATGLDSLPESSSWLTTQFLVVEAAYLLGSPEAAAEATVLLAPYASLPVMPSMAVVCLGSTERALGLAAATLGELDEAVGHLDAALEADRRLGNRPMATLTEHVMAHVLRARGSPDDALRAELASGRAEERARRMGIVLPHCPDWLVTEPRRARRARPERHVSFEPVQGGWKVELDGRATVVSDRIGLSYLAELLARPNQDLDVVTLATGAVLRPSTSTEPVLDEEALRSYRRRARELKGFLERTDLRPADADRCRDELAALTDTLRSAVGLGGRRRSFPSSQERARTAVRKALVRAVAVIAAAEPDLGHHLRQSLVTGVTCRYTPDPRWSVSVRTRPSPPRES